MYLLNNYKQNTLCNFAILDKLPGRSDKGKKRKGIGGVIQTIKENPVEAIALTAGGVLAARYGTAGIKTALRASKRLKPDKFISTIKSKKGTVLNTKDTLGKSINISSIPSSKVKQRKAIALGSAFLKGSGNKARKDIRNLKSVINYAKTGKSK